MRKHLNFLFMIFVITNVLLVINCSPEQNKENDNNNDPFGGINKRNMSPVTGATYTQTDGANSFNHTITGFILAKYEVTYELWYTVKTWAILNDYLFANSGRQGNDGTIGASPASSNYEPVTTINWRDAIVWCNAYSQMTGLTPCYTYLASIIKDSRDTNATACDNAVCTWTNNGYRLPTEGEWQFAASNMGATPWNFGSGGTGAYTGTPVTDYPLFNPIAWYGNSTTSPNGNSITTKDVGAKNANALDIFDMSGNVIEWCWDWYDSYPGTSTDYRGLLTGSYRVIRGGSWNNVTSSLQVGIRNSTDSFNENNFTGFRVAKSF